MGLLPTTVGASKVTAMDSLPATARTLVGLPGGVATTVGLTVFEGGDIAPVPAELVAATVKVYSTPLTRPLTVTGDALAVTVIPPGDDLTVYWVTDAPPELTGAEKLMVALVAPAVALTFVGAPGTVGITAMLCNT